MRGVIAWFARNSVAANLLMLVIVVGGLLTLPRIKMEIFPEVEADLVVVTVPYRGASPEEGEKGGGARRSAPTRAASAPLGFTTGPSRDPRHASPSRR